MTKNKIIDRHVKLPIWLNDRLISVAEEKNENVSTIIRQALVEYVLEYMPNERMGNIK